MKLDLSVSRSSTFVLVRSSKSRGSEKEQNPLNKSTLDDDSNSRPYYVAYTVTMSFHLNLSRTGEAALNPYKRGTPVSRLQKRKCRLAGARKLAQNAHRG